MLLISQEWICRVGYSCCPPRCCFVHLHCPPCMELGFLLYYFVCVACRMRTWSRCMPRQNGLIRSKLVHASHVCLRLTFQLSCFVCTALHCVCITAHV